MPEGVNDHQSKSRLQQAFVSQNQLVFQVSPKAKKYQVAKRHLFSNALSRLGIATACRGSRRGDRSTSESAAAQKK